MLVALSNRGDDDTIPQRVVSVSLESRVDAPIGAGYRGYGGRRCSGDNGLTKVKRECSDGSHWSEMVARIL